MLAAATAEMAENVVDPVPRSVSLWPPANSNSQVIRGERVPTIPKVFERAEVGAYGHDSHEDGKDDKLV